MIITPDAKNLLACDDTGMFVYDMDDNFVRKINLCFEGRAMTVTSDHKILCIYSPYLKNYIALYDLETLTEINLITLNKSATFIVANPINSSI